MLYSARICILQVSTQPHERAFCFRGVGACTTRRRRVDRLPRKIYSEYWISHAGWNEVIGLAFYDVFEKAIGLYSVNAAPYTDRDVISRSSMGW